MQETCYFPNRVFEDITELKKILKDAQQQDHVAMEPGKGHANFV